MASTEIGDIFAKNSSELYSLFSSASAFTSFFFFFNSTINRSIKLAGKNASQSG